MPNELWAALLGGALSLAGTLLTLFLQQRAQRNERKDIVTRFVIEQGEYLRELSGRLEGNFQKHNEVGWKTLTRYLHWLAYFSET
jgi:hypothetical protein